MSRRPHAATFAVTFLLAGAGPSPQSSAASAASGGPAPEYELVVIEPWNTSYSLAVSRVDGLNNLNQVSGCATTEPLGGPCSFLWTREEGKVTINLAGRLNDAGVIVAIDTIRWPDGTLQQLDGAMHGAADINNANVVAGSDGGVRTCPLPPPFVNREATVWSPGGGTVLLEQELGVPDADQAWAISDRNMVVGVRSSTGDCGDHKAFALDLESGAYIDLHAMLVGGPDGITRAMDVNDAGVVVGEGPVTMGGSAFRWSAADGVSILPELAGTLSGYSIPSAINNRGTVVGQAIVGDAWRAWIWDAERGIRDLNEIATGLPDDFTIEEAKQINDHGWIIGRGHFGSWSPERAVVLIPIPTPVTGDLDGDGVVALSDLLTLLASWGGCVGCPADLDADGTVGFADLLVLLGQWSQPA
jgi:hypothetical protein